MDAKSRHTSHGNVARLVAFGCLVVSACLFMPGGNVLGQTSKTAHYVKVSAIAGKPNKMGTQAVIIVLDIDRSCYLYANPVANEILEESRARIVVKIANKPAAAKFQYPPGSTEEPVPGAKFNVYRGMVTITATVQRQPGDASPLDLEIRMCGAIDRAVF